MTLRSKLLFLLLALSVGLGTTQWFLLRSLTQELHEDAAAAAFEVGSSVASALGFHPLPGEPDAPTIPAMKILPSEEALILSTQEQADGEVAIGLRLGSAQELEPRVEASVPMTRLIPAEPARPFTEQEIPIPRQGFDAAFERYASSLTLGFLLLSGLGMFAAGWMALRVSAPLRDLSDAARRLGQGELGLQIPEQGSVEVAATASAFNHMSRELQSYQELARKHREQEHLGEIGEMARTLAHSLRNPLNALGLTLEQHESALRAGGDQWPEAATARAQIRRIEGAVRSLLSITGSDSTQIEDVRLGQVARDVALEATQDFGDGLEIDVQETPRTPDVRAVLPELRAVLQTLLVNAAEASSANQKIECTIRSSADDEWTVEVLDRGQGLELGIEEELFSPHASTKASGTGMGLFLARRIVESRYAGSLDLEQREGGGMRAVLVLHSRIEEAPLA